MERISCTPDCSGVEGSRNNFSELPVNRCNIVMYMLEMRVEVDSAYHRTPGREVKNKIIARI